MAVSAASRRRLKFKSEFYWRNLGFRFTYVGESKNMFIQSKIRCINPVSLLIIRLLVTTYILFAMLLSITTKAGPEKWIIYMTSVNYCIVFIYFITAVSLSMLGVFCKKRYYRDEKSTLKRIQNGRHVNDYNMKAKRGTPDKNGKIGKTNFGTSGSTSYLMDQNENKTVDELRFSVDSIILDIEEISKRTSVQSNMSNSIPRHLNHARLQDNRLPSVNSDVFVETPKDMPVVFQIYWLISSLAINLSFVVACVYWIFLFPSQQKNLSPLLWYLRIDRHAVVFLLVVFDHMINKIPIRILHFIYPSLLFFLYGIFTYVYMKLGGNKIYDMLDFEEKIVRSFLTLLGACLIVMPMAQFILYWAVYRFRERILR